MKAKNLLIPLLLICLSLFAVVGCSNTKSIEYITDIDYYADMQSDGDKIDVHFDNGTKSGFYFTIEDKTDIDEIVNLVLTAQLNNLGSEPVAPGDNTSFTIYQDTKSYGIALNGIMVNNTRYIISSTDLINKLHSIAEAKGAFDTEVGVIYKVIDLQDIESVEEEKITVADKTAILNLLENSFGDCEYFYLFDSFDLAEQYYSSGITENELAAYRYDDAIIMDKGKLLLMYHIYQKYNAQSYYITSPSLGEYVDNGNTMYIELAFGLYHYAYLHIAVVS